MVNRKAVKARAKFCANICRGFIDAHLAIPTYFINPKGIEYLIGGLLPMCGNVFVGLYPIAVYHSLFNHDKNLAAAVLTTQIATNIASGVYELYRWKKIKLESSSIQNPAGPHDLEEKVEEPKRDIPNPWDVDIPEIKDRAIIK